MGPADQRAKRAVANPERVEPVLAWARLLRLAVPVLDTPLKRLARNLPPQRPPVRGKQPRDRHWAGFSSGFFDPNPKSRVLGFVFRRKF